MGFFDSASSVLKSVANSAAEYNAEMQVLKEKMQSKSSSELREIIKDEGFFGSTRKEKTMAYSVLKERGEI
ncbi:hypothetical protein [Phocoenobacter skyensis]|uniref:Transposase n=1 Tax=Phocoenobacter skyensis TaxID=97481 RepID=A0A1H7WQ67_9PAST|nr:hypothetical protein [Pasteurella skyensis]MDP8078996.1 transposase [Pasteurella skyensis]MDP8084946.1 transposase [Pasteurella skyensis]MDP8162788.1 transposase [Pasteurella skyensis]MDP8169923.1 transposase [Pasteurella skyensis]MDP8172625.1 transposase [Pasteurella skyensis]